MPSDRKPLLFVSSTSDLVDERAAVDEAISAKSIEIYRYEEDSAQGSSPKNRLLKKLESTDVYVGIFGAAYGSPYPGAELDGSIVEWEFEIARKQMKRNRTEVLAFVNSNDAQMADGPQKEFLARIGDFEDGVWLKKFANVEQFKIELRDAVQSWLLQYWSRYSRASLLSTRISTLVVAFLLGASLLAIGTGVFAGLVSMTSALLLGGVAVGCGICGLSITNR